MNRVAAVLCGLGALAAPAAVLVVTAQPSATTAVVAGGPPEPDPVGWCWITRACGQ